MAQSASPELVIQILSLFNLGLPPEDVINSVEYAALNVQLPLIGRLVERLVEQHMEVEVEKRVAERLQIERAAIGTEYDIKLSMKDDEIEKKDQIIKAKDQQIKDAGISFDQLAGSIREQKEAHRQEHQAHLDALSKSFKHKLFRLKQLAAAVKNRLQKHQKQQAFRADQDVLARTAHLADLVEQKDKKIYAQQDLIGILENNRELKVVMPGLEKVLKTLTSQSASTYKRVGKLLESVEANLDTYEDSAAIQSVLTDIRHSLDDVKTGQQKLSGDVHELNIGNVTSLLSERVTDALSHLTQATRSLQSGAAFSQELSQVRQALEKCTQVLSTMGQSSSGLAQTH